MHKEELLRSIPSVSEVMALGPFQRHRDGKVEECPFVAESARLVLDRLRRDILDGKIAAPGDMPGHDEIKRAVRREIRNATMPSLKSVINGTGILNHTNLGRAPLAEEALELLEETAHWYSNLEYDLREGRRGSRHAHLGGLLEKLTGAESGMAVNNNAAAVLLALSVVGGAGKEVIVSRGELVEIGGSFRIPDVCQLSGSALREVGATNKTHLRDYEGAIGPDTSAILVVHPSNFSIAGFASKPEPEEIARLASSRGLPLVHDLGSGYLGGFAGVSEKTVAECVSAGADIVTFSGDKLLGGPQAGIAVGKKRWLDEMKAHPLARAVRIDKLSLAALEATLRLHYEKAHWKIPLFAMLSQTDEQLLEKARELQALCGDTAVVRDTARIGGGALPDSGLASYAVEFRSEKLPAAEVERRFRGRELPVLGRIRDGRFALDVFALRDYEFEIISEIWKEINK